MACSIRSIFRNPKRFLFLFFLKFFVVLCIKNGFPLTSWVISRKFDVDYLKNYSKYLEENYPDCFSSSFSNSRLVFIHISSDGNSNTVSDTVACSIRTAIRFNQDSKICILSDDQQWLSDVGKHKLGNLKLIQIQTEALFVDTPLFDWYQYYSQLLGAHGFSSDTLITTKLVYLWKYGGTVFDTNVVSLRTFSNSFKDFLSLQDENETCTNVMKFNAKHRFLKLLMDGIVKNYQMKRSNFVGDYLTELALNDTKSAVDWTLKNSDLFCPFKLLEIKIMLSSSEYDSFVKRMLDTSITLPLPEASKNDLSSKKSTFLKTLLSEICVK